MKLTKKIRRSSVYAKMELLTLQLWWVSVVMIVDPAWAGTPQLAAGTASSFAIDSSGNLYAWGSDEYGQLGLGREVHRTTPNPVSSAQYIDVAVSFNHTLAVRTDGTLWAWGENLLGQLGNGTTARSSTPVFIGNGFRSVATDGLSSFGIREDGMLWAWGYNERGQLGDRTRIQRNSPIPLGTGFAKVATSDGCTYAVRSDGALWRWGRCYWNSGDGTADSTIRNFTEVGSNHASVSVGESHTVAIKRDGSLWTWGQNTEGELGDNTRTPRSTPVKIGDGYKSVVAGMHATVALKLDGTLWGWGSNNDGQLGLLPPDGSYSAPQLMGRGFSAVAFSVAGHGLALKTDGTVWSWGLNHYGGLGDGGTQDRIEFKQIGSDFIAVAAGDATSAAIKADNTLWTWGDNRSGQLGYTAPTMRAVPVLVGTDFVTVATSKDSGFSTFDIVLHAHTLGIRKDRSLWAWGDNRYGQLGVGTENSHSVPVQVGSDYISVATSSEHTLAIKSDGSLWAWGANYSGELGIGTRYNQVPTPTKVGMGFAAVAARLKNSTGLGKDGTVWSWGGGVSSPARVPGLTNVTAITEGRDHTLALRADGTVWAWGGNSFGQLGDGTSISRSTPTQITALSNIVAISAGGSYFSLALRSDGSLWAWGLNLIGTMGDGTMRSSNVPKQIGSGFSNISAGWLHAIAGKTDGSVRAWGWNESHRLGDGSAANSPVPVAVVNRTATGFLSLVGEDLDNSLDAFKVLQIVDKTSADLTTRITDLRAAGLDGEIFFTVIVPPNSPLVAGCTAGGCARGATALSVPGSASKQRLAASAGPLNSKSVDRRSSALADTSGGMVTGVIGRGGFKQTGGNSYVQAESAYTGVLSRSGTLSVVSKTVLENSNALICMGVTIPELSAKGQVLMRPIATGSAIQGVVQCPPVQTAATITQFRAEASGPITARTVVAQINPLAEDRGTTRKVFSWAVAPDGRQYMQTGPNQWEDMTEPMRPAATITVPTSGPYRLEVTKALNLNSLSGTLVFIGIGESWEEVRGLNKAGHYYTVQ